MVTRRRSSEKKRAKGLAAAAKILGKNVEDLPQPSSFSQTMDSKTVEALACIIYLDTGGRDFTRQICPVCNREYAVQYAYQTRGLLCSDECRAAHLAGRGIRWDSSKTPAERWNKRIPIVVVPSALPILDEVLSEQASKVESRPEPTAVAPILPAFDVLDPSSIDDPPIRKAASVDELFS